MGLAGGPRKAEALASLYQDENSKKIIKVKKVIKVGLAGGPRKVWGGSWEALAFLYQDRNSKKSKKVIKVGLAGGQEGLGRSWEALALYQDENSKNFLDVFF